MKKILIVDDEPDIVASISELLQRNRYNVISAVDGEEGLDKALDEAPDLILLDIMMPKRDGFAMLGSLKSNEKVSHVPVIMVTAREETRSILESRQLGAADYFIKPFNVKNLLNIINRYLA